MATANSVAEDLDKNENRDMEASLVISSSVNVEGAVVNVEGDGPLSGPPPPHTCSSASMFLLKEFNTLMERDSETAPMIVVLHVAAVNVLTLILL